MANGDHTDEAPNLLREVRALELNKRRNVPMSVIERRDLDGVDFTSGGALTAPRLRDDVPTPIRRPRPFAERVGIDFLPGLEGNGSVGLPVQTGKSTVHWRDSQRDEPQETRSLYGNVVLEPKHVSGYLNITRNLLLQTTPVAEAYLRRELRASVFEAVERVTLQGNGEGEPLGLDNTDGTTIDAAFADASTPTRAEVIAQIGKVTSQNVAREDIVAVMAPEFATLMAGVEVSAGSGRYLVDGDMLAGRVRYEETAHCPASTVFYGQWSDVVVGTWGDLELMLDPYSDSLSGGIRVVVHFTAGVGFRRRSAFVKGA